MVEAIQPFTDTPVERTVVEQMLAYQPWRSPTDRAAYRAAKKKAGYDGEYGGFDWVVPFIENAAPEVQQRFLEECADLFAWSDQFPTSYQSMAEKAAAWSCWQPAKVGHFRKGEITGKWQYTWTP